MPKYRYTVINPENKQLSGSISAPDEKSAREELNQLGFSIISIAIFVENSETNTNEKPVPKFEFAATDKNMKRIVGSIQAENRYGAYKRLIKEYIFEVEYLIDADADESTKSSQKQKGVYELQNKLDEEDLSLKKTNPDDNFDSVAFAEQQKNLQLQVEFVLKKVKEILDLYENEIKAETKEKIRKYVDKILRIKSSTNLEYIRKNCEDLLIFLQKEEIFLHEEEKLQEHAKLSLEAKSMMIQLHHKNDTANIDISQKLKDWRQNHITKNDQPSLVEKFINFWLNFIIGFKEESEETRAIRGNISVVNKQLKQYLGLYFQANTNEFKIEAREGLKRLYQEREKLIKDLKATQKSQKLAAKMQTNSTTFENLFDEVQTFSGWLLAFYLLYYFVTFYITNKNFGTIIKFPEIITFNHSAFLKYFLSLLFLFHCAVSIKMDFFRRNEVATVIITPLFLISSVMILLNF